ncbi:hypothetical protein ACFPU1_13790 [Thalassorhabdus alkalitolerans]|uniref:Uncharacterized protein n=1 Tax=Thalassorhabdus alkalitolerans TaxID=2282697 RepID=A0ABW0YR44_9BACI|nr:MULTISPECIES: hypothetical protein [Bacillaceae]
MRFDVSLVSRVSEDIEDSAKRLREIVNSPQELSAELQKIESCVRSLQSLSEGQNQAGANAANAQHAPDQNQT